MTERNLKRSAMVGVGITLGAMLIAYLIGGTKIFERNYTVRAEFTDASDIATGDPVRVAGIEVGQVTAVEREPETVKLTMDIKQAVKLSSGTQAAIKLRTLLGKKFVELADPGTGPKLKAGTLIPLSRTHPATDVDEVVTSFKGDIHQADVQAINNVMRSFDQIMAGRTNDVHNLLGDLDSLATTLAQRKQDIDRLLAANIKLLGAVDDRRQQLGTSLDGMATALDTLAARKAELTEMVDGIKSLSEKLQPLVQRNEGTLDSVLTDIKTTAGVLAKDHDRLDLAITQLPQAIYALRKVVKQGSWINVYTIGFPGTPYLMDPIDLGDNASRDPGKDGGLPKIWLRPPPHDTKANVAGVQVDTGNHNDKPAPEGYFTEP